MKKITLGIMCWMLIFPNTFLFAQTENTKQAVVHLSFWDPIGSNGSAYKEYTNTFSFNLLYGGSYSERAFVFSGLVSVIQSDATGVQFAGLANVIGNARGLSFAGLTNITGNVNGLQFAGLTNITGNTNGLQFAGLGNITGNTNGLQFGGLGNITGNTNGFQFGGLGNIAGDVRGLQFAGFNNIAGNLRGLQFAGIFNVAAQVEGFQFSGICNMAGVVKGAQFAGIFNVAKHCDYPVGLVNLIKDGEKSLGVEWDELQNIMPVFRSGSRIMYGVLGIGYNFKSSENPVVFQGGFGVHIPCSSKFRINTELTETTLTQFKDAAYRTSIRVLPSFRFGQGLEVFAGPTLNYLETSDPVFGDLFSNHSLWKNTVTSPNANRQQLYAGYLVGLQYVF